MAEQRSCYSCGSELEFAEGNVGRSESCPSCSADVRVCYNCKHYDSSAYNECHEPQADRVVDKDKRNFCDYFFFAGGQVSGKGKSKDDVLKDLDDLFK